MHELEMRAGDGVALEVAVDISTALQRLETGQIGYAVYEIKNALCALGLWDAVKARTGALTVLNQKNGHALTHASPEWLDVLRKDGWIRHSIPPAPPEGVEFCQRGDHSAKSDQFGHHETSDCSSRSEGRFRAK